MTSLVERLTTVCDEALAALSPGPGQDVVRQIRAKLEVPLTVTVAGGVSSGKSTLVNALLGQRVAAVDAGECTRVVAEYRYGAHERAEVVGTDGLVTRMPLDRGRVPADLGRPAGEIARVVVHLSNNRLADLTVVDTPGLNTVTEVNEASTSAFLGVSGKEGADTAAAVGGADALVFLLPLLRQADAAVLKGFSKLYEGSGLSAVNAVAVLSKVDRLARDGDPLMVAAPIAQRAAAELRGVVSDVVPVVGLLAETAQAAVFTEDDARDLEAVAAVTDPFDREDMLLSPEDFLTSDLLDLDPARRRRLLGLLDLHGLGVAIATIDAGRHGAGALLRAFDEHSGLQPLRDVVFGRFASQAGLLKAHAAVCDLRRASYLRTDPDNARTLRGLRAPLEKVELDPAMHRLRLLEVAGAVATGGLELPGELLEDVTTLTSSGDPLGRVAAGGAAEGRALAAAGATRWASWGNDPRRSPDEVRFARITKEAYEVLWSELDRASS